MLTEHQEVVFFAKAPALACTNGGLFKEKDARILGTGSPEPEQLEQSVQKVRLLFQDARVERLKLKPAGK